MAKVAYLLTKNRRINFKYLFFISGVGIIFLGLVTVYLGGLREREVSVVFKAFTSRLLANSLAPAYIYLERFPAHMDFLWGKSFPNPGGVFPWDSYPLTIEMMKYWFPEFAKKGIIGSAPTVFWAEIYANFGPASIFIFSILTGIGIYFLYAILSRINNSPVKTGIITWVSLHLMNLSITSFSNFIFDAKIFTILFIGIGLMFIGGKGKIKFQKR